MIRVQFDPQTPELRMCGHAGQGARGSDVVCAAASVLLFTLLSELIRLGVEHRREMLPGYAKVTAQGGEEVFRCVCTGLMLLAENFPQAVSFTERAVEGASPYKPQATAVENVGVGAYDDPQAKTADGTSGRPMAAPTRAPEVPTKNVGVGAHDDPQREED